MRLLDKILDRIAEAIAGKLDLGRTGGAGSPAIVKSALAPSGSLVQPFVDQVEWEPLARPRDAMILRVGESSGNLGRLSVRRDDEYRLAVSVTASGDASWTAPHFAGLSGSLNEGVEIEAEEQPGRNLLLPNAVVTGTTTSFARGHPDATTVRVQAHRVVRRLSASAPALFVDWFISGPSETHVLWRSTKRLRSESYARSRQGPSGASEEHRFSSDGPPGGARTEASSRDYLLLDLATGPVRICAVPKGNAPEWTRPIGIEHEARDAEPSDDLRNGLVEALGFMFGRHILRVGTTVFDATGRSIRDEAISPWGRDVIDMASRPDLPPTPLFDWTRGSQAEAVLTPLVAAYLGARDELNLSHAVWTGWLALRMPLSFDTPLFASALEALMKGWFASKRTKTGGLYMPSKEFRATFAGALDGFSGAATGLPYGDRIVRKVGRANEMGVNERFEVFFEELRLPVGEGEDAVIRARNISSHGAKSGRSTRDLMMLGNGYRTLLNRVVLKLLGYTGVYTDYSAVGHAQRPIDEPIGYRPPPAPPKVP